MRKSFLHANLLGSLLVMNALQSSVAAAADRTEPKSQAAPEASKATPQTGSLATLPPRTVPPRTVPVPDTVSAEFQHLIAHPNEPLTRVPPKTDDEWRALVARHVELRSVVLEEARKNHPGTIEAQTRAGVKCHLVTPEKVAAKNRNRVLVHIHGGAYVFGPGPLGALEAVVVAHYAQMPIISIDYRMPPDHPFPAGLEDCVALCQDVLKTYKPKHIGMLGTSAGGGLAAATLLKLRELKVPLPAALELGTPWADLSKTGDTYFANEGLDDVLLTYDGVLGAAARLYAGSHDLKDPLLSPVYGDFHDFPPTMLVAGTRDMLLSATVRVHRKLRQAHVPADLHVFEAMQHGFYLALPGAPESREVYEEIALFFDKHLAP